MAGNIHTELHIVNRVLEALAQDSRVVWCHRLNSGLLPAASGRRVRAGWLGAPDIIGMLQGGRLLALEIKRPGRRATQAQAAFLRCVRQGGGVGEVLHSAAELPLLIAEAAGACTEPP